MDQRKSNIFARAWQNISCPWWIKTQIIYINKHTGKNEAKHFMSMMDQQKSNILAKAYKKFHVHDGSTEIVYKQKRSNTVYVHDGSTEFIYIGKSITKYLMSMMDQRKSYILTNTQKKTKQNILCPWWINRNCIHWQKIIQMEIIIHDGST